MGWVDSRILSHGLALEPQFDPIIASIQKFRTHVKYSGLTKVLYGNEVYRYHDPGVKLHSVC